MRPPREDTKPWYKQFWPWVIISLPGSVVIAGFITLYIAANTSDSLVVDEYYKEGLAVNQKKARERIAAELGIEVQLSYNASTGQMEALINDAPVGDLSHLQLALAHPTLSEWDASVQLESVGKNAFSGVMPLKAGGIDWHVIVMPPSETWKLRGRWNPLNNPRITLAAQTSDQNG